MHTTITRLSTSLFVLLLLMPGAAFGQTFEVSGWLPYWRSQKSVESTLPQLQHLTEVNPFIYTVRKDGTLNVESPLTNGEWVTLRTQAKAQGIRFIPTVMWGDGDTIHAILSNPETRAAHVRAIAHEVFAQNLDGIDIDYEAKRAETRPYFSLFLKELYDAIGYNKWVMCTIESRTPLDSRYASPEAIPVDIEYSNDFLEINKYCDRVRIMAYDQGRIDLKLNDANAHPYIPVADTAWVEKVMRLALQDIAAEKLVLGIPTYGYEYDTFTDQSGDFRYSRLWSFNPGYADEVAQKLGITPTRNSAGELFLTYPASQSPDPVIPLPNATRIMSWSDDVAIQSKIALAQSLGIRGIALFKIDGGQDPDVAQILTQTGVSGAQKVASKPVDTGLGLSTETGGGTITRTSSAVPTKDLKYGMRTEEVRVLQKFLNAQGYTVAQSGGGSPGNETTFFGPATRAALTRFQSAHAISPAVGYYGPITRSTIKTKNL